MNFELSFKQLAKEVFPNAEAQIFPSPRGYNASIIFTHELNHGAHPRDVVKYLSNLIEDSPVIKNEKAKLEQAIEETKKYKSFYDSIKEILKDAIKESKL